MFDFPNNPTTGQQVTGPGGAVFQWDGVKWISVSGGGLYVNKGGDTMTGALTLAANAASALQAVPLQQLTSTTAPAFNDDGRNIAHNAEMRFWQRGTGPFTTAGAYTADRWVLGLNTDTNSVTTATLTDTDRSQIGDEGATFALQDVFTGNAAATAYSIFIHRIENVRRHSNKTLTVSFWAKCASGTLQLGMSLDQNFGTGGSPSAAVTGTGTAVTITTTWARYSATFTLPSTAGKTLGTNGDSQTQFNIWLSCSTNFASRAGNIPVQSGTVTIWGVQIEVGSTMTQLAKRDPQVDLALCQRFYQVGFTSFWGYGAAASAIGSTQLFPVVMRGAPAIVYNSPAYTNASAVTATSVFAYSLATTATATATGNAAFTSYFTASADL